MISINLKLLNKYFLQNSKHNVLFNIFGVDEITLEKENFNDAMEHLKNILSMQKEYSGLYTVNSNETLLIYIVEIIYHDLKQYIQKFDNKNDFLLFIYINTVLFLTFFTKNALTILESIPNLIYKNLDVETKDSINSFIASNDPRGLIYYCCLKYKLPYDLLIKNQSISYDYREPSINNKWQKKYKQENQPIIFWFYESIIGKALFLVLYTPKCRYKMEKGGCSGCNLPTVSASSKDLNTDNVIQQIDQSFNNNLSENEKNSIQELMLSNNGSILDSKTMDILSLKYAVSKAIELFHNLKKIIFETRIDDYTNIKQLQIIKNILKENSSNIKLEIAVGFEIFDDNLRNGYYKKGLDKNILEEKMKVLARLDISLKIYMMYKAVPDSMMSIDDAIDDLNNASQYFSDLAKLSGLKINMHISPTYLAAGTPLYKEYVNNKYTPPSMQDIDKMYNSLNIKENISYYISMNNEGLGEDDGSDMGYDDIINLKNKIYQFNINNYK